MFTNDGTNLLRLSQQKIKFCFCARILNCAFDERNVKLFEYRQTVVTVGCAQIETAMHGLNYILKDTSSDNEETIKSDLSLRQKEAVLIREQ